MLPSLAHQSGLCYPTYLTVYGKNWAYCQGLYITAFMAWTFSSQSQFLALWSPLAASGENTFSLSSTPQPVAAIYMPLHFLGKWEIPKRHLMSQKSLINKRLNTNVTSWDLGNFVNSLNAIDLYLFE